MGHLFQDEVVMGRIALFNMWDSELSLEEIRILGCESRGNILTMSNMIIGGPTFLTTEDVPCELGMWS